MFLLAVQPVPGSRFWRAKDLQTGCHKSHQKSLLLQWHPSNILSPMGRFMECGNHHTPFLLQGTPLGAKSRQRARHRMLPCWMGSKCDQTSRCIGRWKKAKGNPYVVYVYIARLFPGGSGWLRLIFITQQTSCEVAWRLRNSKQIWRSSPSTRQAGQLSKANRVDSDSSAKESQDVGMGSIHIGILSDVEGSTTSRVPFVRICTLFQEHP